MSDFENLKKEILINLTNAPLSEKVLASRIGVHDRAIREAVSSLIEDLHPILSNTKGLWLETDPTIILQHAEKNHSIGLSYMTRGSHLKRTVEEKFGQLKMKVY